MSKQSYPSKFEFREKKLETYSSFHCSDCSVCGKHPLDIPYYWVYRNDIFEELMFYYTTVCSPECQVMLMLKEM